MKSGRMRTMNGRGHEIGIDLDPSYDEGAPSHDPHSTSFPSTLHPHTHSRSQSWSFNSRGQRLGGTADLTTSLAALNPITSVIREMVPSFGQDTDSSARSSPARMSRTTSQVTLPLRTGVTFDTELVREESPPTSAAHPHPHRTVGGRAEGSGEGEDQQNIGFEISDGIRWLEHNAIFIVLLLLKFAWYHRSGKCVRVCVCVCVCIYAIAYVHVCVHIVCVSVRAGGCGYGYRCGCVHAYMCVHMFVSVIGSMLFTSSAKGNSGIRDL